MVSLDKKMAIVVDGKSARACDNCVKKRARWYCGADDAFLCQSCDSSVHSANPLAHRHKRVHLKTTFNDRTRTRTRTKHRISMPSWHEGFTRKARTPRKNKHVKYGPVSNMVPEISGEEENEEQLLYRVPVFDPFNVCTSEMGDAELGFHPSEMDLVEFAADVESLLGKGLDDIDEGLAILDDHGREKERECSMVKVEDAVVDYHIDTKYFIGFGRGTFELNFDYDDDLIPNNIGDGEDDDEF